MNNERIMRGQRVMRTTMRKAMIAILSIGFLFSAVPSVTQAATDAVDTRGFLHGTVETRSGKQYTGVLRWGNEEAFWDDLFNSSKKDLPYMELRPEGEEEHSEFKIFGVTIGYRWDGSASSRQFVARFGDIVEIRPGRGERAEVLMKSGTTHRIDGASNDLGGTIVVLDGSLGEVEVPWKRIVRIAFSPTPASVRAPATRLYGRLITEDDTFEGWIQWDSQECRTRTLNRASPARPVRWLARAC